MSGSKDPLSESKASLNRIQLSSLLIFIGVCSVYLAISTSADWSLYSIVAIALMILLRVPLIRCARMYWISVPLLLLFVAIPISIEWEFFQRVWMTTKHQMPLFGWVVCSLIYVVLPTFVLMLDAHNHYLTRRQLWARYAIDVILMSMWYWVVVVVILEFQKS